MAQKLVNTLFIFFLVLLLIAGITLANAYLNNLPNQVSQHETLIYGQNRLAPGSQAALRVVVRDTRDAKPLSGAQIKVSLKDSRQELPLYTGATNDLGTAEVSFKVPAALSGDAQLIVETNSRLGKDRVARPVSLERDYRLLLSTDKPLYQPGQVIHLRLLAVNAFDLTPAASQKIEVTIADGKGNKVFRKPLDTNEFGVAFTDFQLAGEVNTGAYKLSAALGNTTSEKTVNVERYVLPKFTIDLKTERAYYQPGQNVTGILHAGYFYGKPVAGGQVTLEGVTFDVASTTVFKLEGVTDANGDYNFEFDLPKYLAGSDLDNGRGRFYLKANLTDLAKQTEGAGLSIPVAQQNLVIQVVPEGGRLRSGVENTLYVLVSYPDGSPAEASLDFSSQDGNATNIATGPYGLAEIKIAPQSTSEYMVLQAKDEQGNTARRELNLAVETGDSVLLRPDKPVYRVGETMTVTVLTAADHGTVYLDLVRQGQTVSTRSLEIKSGLAQAAVDLTPDLYGTLELHAYKLAAEGIISRDTRLVVVDSASDLSIQLKAGKDTYLPGEQAGLDVQVSGKDGAGVHSALGLAVVDESVFALAEQDPGFAKLYFLLEQELLQPKYDLHGFSIPDLVEPVSAGKPLADAKLRSAVEGAAQASLSEVKTTGPDFSLQANSHQDAVKRSYELQRKFALRLGQGLYGLLLLAPLAALLLTGAAVRREKRLSQSVAVVMSLALAAVLLFILWPSEGQSFASSPLEKLGRGLEWLMGSSAELVVAILALAGLIAFFGLLWLAFRQKDHLLGAALAMLPLFLAVVFFLAVVSQRFLNDYSEWLVVWGLLAYLLLPLGFLVRAAGYGIGKRPGPALAALVLSVFLLLGLLPFLNLAMESRATQNFGGPMILEDRAVGGMAPVEEALPMAFATQAPAAKALAPQGAKPADAGSVESSAAQQSAQPPRLRQYFPETMLWLPDVTTDAAGQAHLDFPVADSITTWRVTALASSQDGRLGSATAGLRVFQDFFIDLDLPLALTAGDEIAVPVGVFNYLNQDQSVQLTLEKAPWFELLDEPVKTLNIAANDISVVYFRVRALQFGQQAFKVTALGSKMSDAIQKEIQVYPNGKPLSFTHSDRLSADSPVRQEISIPAEAIPGTQSLLVKIYPGVLSQVVEGLDSILRMPNGCFEQTSSSTYPNVLVLDYLKSTKQAAPESEMKAEQYINLGYQRLLTFEVQGSGGFSLFGEEPADRMLTAYGLQEFTDMSRVHDVDPALLERAANWLMSQQDSDGSWANDRGLVHENTWQSLGNDRLPVTAYIAWSLTVAGFDTDPRTQKGLDYVREHQAEAEDPYALALVANALVSADLKAGGTLNPATAAILDRLAGLAQTKEKSTFWESGVASFTGSRGHTGSLETTALAALAFLRAGQQVDLANQALTYLVQNKDGFGTWENTQATVLSLKALIESVRSGGEHTNAAVTIKLNGGQARTVQVTPENFDVVQMVSFSDVNPGQANTVEISSAGQGSLMYQISGNYYLPWDKLALHPELGGGSEPVAITVGYDRTQLAVNDTVAVSVTVALNQAGTAQQALIDLGVPPGFTVQAEDLAALVARFQDRQPGDTRVAIQRFELTGRQILLYVTNLTYGQPLTFTYHLQAKFPLTAQAPASNAYDYYNPGTAGLSAPQMLVVK